MPFTENRLQNCRCHRPEKGPRPARLHATSPKTGPGAVWGELIRKRANLDARRAPDRCLSVQNVTCHQGPKLGPSERGYMQITEFEPLSHHRKLPNLGLHRMRDTKRLFGGPRATRSVARAPGTSAEPGRGLRLRTIRETTFPQHQQKCKNLLQDRVSSDTGALLRGRAIDARCIGHAKIRCNRARALRTIAIGAGAQQCIPIR